MRIKSLFLLALVLGFSTPMQAADDRLVLATLLDEFMVGASIDSAAAHDRFWAEDLVYTSSAGLRFGKASIMEGVSQPSDNAEPEVPTVYTAEDVNIQLFDDAAVVTFRLVGTTQVDQPLTTEYLNTGTFLKREGEWRAVAWQATRIPEENTRVTD